MKRTEASQNIHPYDLTVHNNDHDVGFESEDFSFTILLTLKEVLQEHKIRLPKNLLFLGLAAGQGQRELSVAHGLKARYIQLVDRNPQVREGWIKNKRSTQVISEGIYTYLQNYQGKKFNLATALGIEYVLEKPGRLHELLKLLSNVMQPNGIVIISPNTTPINSLEELGFTELYSDRSFLIFCKKSK